MKTENLDQQYLENLKNIEFEPVFILGLHRSGTSILYKMLSETQLFNSVTAYHIICYDQLLYNSANNLEEDAKKELTNSFLQQGQEDRGIDKLKVTADFAEEYGFLLSNKGYSFEIDSKSLPLFIEMIKKIQYISKNNKFILLKNPFDLVHFLFIKEKIPNAKFIFIHRNPYPVLSSLMKASRFLLKKNDLYALRLNRFYKKIHENPLALYLAGLLTTTFSSIGMIILTLFSARSTNYYLKNIKRLPKEDYISITYEELCKNPDINIEKILRSLNIKPTIRIDYGKFIETRKMDIDPGVISMRRFIYKSMKKYFKEFNYGSEIKE